MSEEARKRLQAIFNASELGAGLPDRAVRPRDPRRRQHPRRASSRGTWPPSASTSTRGCWPRRWRSGRRRTRAGRRCGRAPQAVVDLPVEAHLPDDYVPDEAQKLELYRRLARARTAGDLAAFRQEVIDRFGPMPAAGRAARRGRRAAAAPPRRRRLLDLARGGPARRALRGGAVPRDGDAARDVGGAPGRPRRGT